MLCKYSVKRGNMRNQKSVRYNISGMNGGKTQRQLQQPSQVSHQRKDNENARLGPDAHHANRKRKRERNGEFIGTAELAR